MEKLGDLDFRTGGSAGGEGWLLGRLDQLSQSLQSFTVYRCAACGKVEFWQKGS